MRTPQPLSRYPDVSEGVIMLTINARTNGWLTALRTTVIKLGRRSLITRQASAAWQERMIQRADEQA